MHEFMKMAFEPVTTVLLFDKSDLRGADSSLPWFFLDDMEEYSGQTMTARVLVLNNDMDVVLEKEASFIPEGRVWRIGDLRLSAFESASDMLYFIVDLYGPDGSPVACNWYYSNFESRKGAIFEHFQEIRDMVNGRIVRR